MSRSFGRASTSRLAFSVLAFTIVAACSSAPPAGSPGAPAGSGRAVPSQPTAPNSDGGVPVVNCQTIAEADLVTIVDRDFVEATPFGEIACTWVFADMASASTAGPDARVYVRWANDDTTLAGVKGLYPAGEDVNIGDRGYWVEQDSSLYVAKGAHAYGISLSGFDPTDPRQDMAIEIARLLLTKV